MNEERSSVGVGASGHLVHHAAATLNFPLFSVTLFFMYLF